MTRKFIELDQRYKDGLEEHHISISRAPAFQNDDITMINTQMGDIPPIHSISGISKKPTIIKRVIGLKIDEDCKFVGGVCSAAKPRESDTSIRHILPEIE